jgi:hypothetical protein
MSFENASVVGPMPPESEQRNTVQPDVLQEIGKVAEAAWNNFNATGSAETPAHDEADAANARLDTTTDDNDSWDHEY